MAGSLPKPVSDRTRVRRSSKRASYDRETILDILDAGLHCHVAFIWGDHPVVIPTLYWHDRERLYIHGSRASRMLRAVERRAVCIAVTHIDGLVLAHSAFHHSANYRSVTVFGTAIPVEDDATRLHLLRMMMDRHFPDRWDRLRPVQPQELAGTRVLSIELSEASAKIRSGPPQEDEADLAWPVWAGVIPISNIVGDPIPDPATLSRDFEPIDHRIQLQPSR